jgi:ABC-type multidrug transport system ATPase subunit/pSer/pThr/pTyr-binding forkhead associated (FHA) protein
MPIGAKLIQKGGAGQGHEIALDVAVVIGRSEKADVVLEDQRASRLHLQLRPEMDTWMAVDLRSTNGTLLNGKKLAPDAPTRIDSGARLRLGDTEFLFIHDGLPFDPPTQTVPLKQSITIGRDAGCDIIIPSPSVSDRHCRITQSARGWLLEDLNSQNGTYLNGVRVLIPEPVREGDEIRLHLHRFVFRNGTIEHFDQRQRVQIEVEALCRTVKKGREPLDLLQSVSFVVPPQEVVAIVGASGAGKSTLLNAMTGFHPASSGQVRFNGINLYTNHDLLRSTIGYVPQEDFVHRELRVGAALNYAAELRLPPDTKPSERDALVQHTLQTLELNHRKSARISTLSGGERKRVNIAMELLSQPSVMFLDEPTSGLDPGLERKFVEILRQLAHEGRTIVMVTHATSGIAECDKLLFLARGGRVAFYGPPKDALNFFGVTDYADAYLRVNDGSLPAHYWEEKYRQSEYFRRYVDEPLAVAKRHRKDEKPPVATSAVTTQARPQPARQFSILRRRYVDTLRGDGRNLALLFAQAPLIALIFLAVFPANLFHVGRTVTGASTESMDTHRSFLLFCMVISALLFGVINAAREVTKERAIYRRERMINMQPGPYLLSKMAALSMVSIVQSVLLIAVTQLKIDFHLGIMDELVMIALLILMNLCGTMLGLLLSVFASTNDQAMSLVPFAVLPQIIFSGLIDLQSIGSLGKVVPSYWAYGALGNLMQLNHTSAILGMQPKDQFSIAPALAICALLGIGAVYAVLALMLLARKR